MKILTFRKLDARTWARVPRCQPSFGATRAGERAFLSRVRAGAFLPDGSVAIADGGSRRIKLFGRDGHFSHDVGQPGDDPGEFNELAWVRVVGDTLIAFDPHARRVSYFAENGVFLRSTTLAGDWLPSAQVHGPLPHEQWLEVRLGTALRPDDQARGHQRPRREYVLLDAAGSLVDTVGMFPQTEVVRTTVRGSALPVVLDVPPLFGRQTYTAVHGSGFIVADNEAFDLRFFDVRGHLTRSLRVRVPSIRVRPADVASFIAAAVQSGDPRTRTTRERILESAPARETLPAHGEVAVDAEGRVWVREYALPGEHNRDWFVFTDSGVYLGKAVIPRNLSVLDIGKDALLGHRVDHAGVESVVSCKIARVDS